MAQRNHIGSLAADVDLAAEVLDAYPNFNVELGGRQRDLINQDRHKVRAFFITYQDRILYGSDFTVRPTMEDEPEANERRKKARITRYSTEFRYLETSDTFTFGNFTGQGLSLPPAVLQKIYWGNPKRLIPGI
jgi:predicted TIM-barrel fold metal-dependent hydrolase